MHISDGVLPPEVWISGAAVAGAGVTYILAKKTEAENIPKLAMVTATLFTVSLIHIPVPPTSVHLILSGMAGIALGLCAFPAVFVALILHVLLFPEHGGVSTLGVNTIIMGVPALAAYGVFWLGMRTNFTRKYAIFGALAGGGAIALGVIILYLFLLTIGTDPGWLLLYVVLPHIAVLAIEAVIVGVFAESVAGIRPDILQGYKQAKVTG